MKTPNKYKLVIINADKSIMLCVSEFKNKEDGVFYIREYLHADSDNIEDIDYGLMNLTTNKITPVHAPKPHATF